jgi:benzylsuccinate CoA-transferase BbsF subunit
MAMEQGILSGIRVLDFTRVLAGPYATRILADFGAEVIKVQSGKTSTGAESNVTGYFSFWNRNKRSITLDMSFPEAKELAIKLTKRCDVVIENFSPRVMSNWGLNYELLRKVKPNVIMVSMSTMGQTGPWRDYIGYGPTLQALSGLTYLTSFDQDVPVGLGFPYADMIAGFYAALGVLGALEHRDRTGQGQYIDLSEYEVACSTIASTLLDALINEKEVPPQGNRSDHIPAAPYGCYRCAGEDRWCVIAVFEEDEWKALCGVLGHPSWTKEERFSTFSNRKRHEEELNQRLEQWTLLHSPEEVVDLLQVAGIPAGVVQSAEDLAKDPHLAARGFFVGVRHPVLGEIFSDAPPIRFIGSPPICWKAAPLLGEANRYVYLELLGMSEDELSSYLQRGIIG